METDTLENKKNQSMWLECVPMYNLLPGEKKYGYILHRTHISKRQSLERSVSKGREGVSVLTSKKGAQEPTQIIKSIDLHQCTPPTLTDPVIHTILIIDIPPLPLLRPLSTKERLAGRGRIKP